MRWTWLRIRFWGKLVVLAAVVAYVIAFIAKNSGKTVQLWFWYGKAPEQSLLAYSLIVFLFGFVAAISGWLLRGTLRQYQQLRQMRVERRRQQEMEKLKAAVQSDPAKVEKSQ